MNVEITLMHLTAHQHYFYIYAYPNYQLWVLILRLAHPSRIRISLLYILHLHSPLSTAATTNLAKAHG